MSTWRDVLLHGRPAAGSQGRAGADRAGRQAAALAVLLVLAVAAGVAVLFGVGILVGRSTAPAAPRTVTSGASAAAASGAAAAQSGAGGGFGGAGARGSSGGSNSSGLTGVQGTIQSISRDSLTIRTADGTTQTVNLAPQTQVITTTPASADALTPGTPVRITGQPNPDGSISAGTITFQQTYSPLPPIGTPAIEPTSPAGAPPTGGDNRAPTGP